MEADETTQRLRDKDAEEANSTRRGRRRKFSREEVHRRLVETAVAEVVTTGLSYGLTALRLDRVIALADVPRSAAYELFEDDELAPQDALRRETVLSIVRDMPSGNAAATQDVGLATVEELRTEIGSNDMDTVLAARRQVINSVARFNQEQLNSQMWRTYRTLVSSTLTSAEPDPPVLAAIEAGEQKLVDAYEALFVDFASVFRMKLKPGYTLRLFTLSIIALNEGLANRSAAFSDQKLLIDSHEWTALGAGAEALCAEYFTIELD